MKLNNLHENDGFDSIVNNEPGDDSDKFLEEDELIALEMAEKLCTVLNKYKARISNKYVKILDAYGHGDLEVNAIVSSLPDKNNLEDIKYLTRYVGMSCYEFQSNDLSNSIDYRNQAIIPDLDHPDIFAQFRDGEWRAIH